MPKVQIYEDEDYYYEILVEDDILDKDLTIEVDSATLARWQRIISEYKALQEELYYKRKNKQ